MKATGIVRRIDPPPGRFGCPKELRHVGHWDGDPMEIYTDGNDIILRKYNPGLHGVAAAWMMSSCGGNKMCCKCIRLFVKELDVQRG